MFDWKKALILCVVGVPLMVVGCAKQEEAPAPAPVAEQPAAPPPMTAVAVLQPRGDLTFTGSVSFTQVGDTVTIAGHVEGVAPGKHGFHLHELGDCSAEDFTSTGGHFNPTDAPHGGPDDRVRHAGDFGNIEVGEDGVGHVELTSEMITVADGPNTVVGRAIILHEGEDDLESQPTGAAGGRIACGVVAPPGG
jgi:Cu-Zn family superoxide dismutase